MLLASKLCFKQQRGEADDPVHRRADFMTDIGKKFAFRPACSLRGVNRLAQTEICLSQFPRPFLHLLFEQKIEPLQRGMVVLLFTEKQYEDGHEEEEYQIFAEHDVVNKAVRDAEIIDPSGNAGNECHQTENSADRRRFTQGDAGD